MQMSKNEEVVQVEEAILVDIHGKEPQRFRLSSLVLHYV